MVVCGLALAEAARVVADAIDRGVNYFDVAPAYFDGEAELKLGQALRGRRDGVFYACKTTEREAALELMASFPLDSILFPVNFACFAKGFGPQVLKAARELARESLYFALSQGIVAAIPPGDERLFSMALDLASDYAPLSEERASGLLAAASEIAPLFRYPSPEA